MMAAALDQFAGKPARLDTPLMAFDSSLVSVDDRVEFVILAAALTLLDQILVKYIELDLALGHL